MSDAPEKNPYPCVLRALRELHKILYHAGGSIYVAADDTLEVIPDSTKPRACKIVFNDDGPIECTNTQADNHKAEHVMDIVNSWFLFSKEATP